MSTKDLVDGKQAPVSITSWKSFTTDRTCRNPGGSETKAAVECEDDVFYIRASWAEHQKHFLNLQDPAVTVADAPGVLASDSRNLYDRVTKPVIPIKAAEKRSDMEGLMIKESMNTTSLDVRWVYSDAELASPLTKIGEKHQL